MFIVASLPDQYAILRTSCGVHELEASVQDYDEQNGVSRDICYCRTREVATRIVCALNRDATRADSVDAREFGDVADPESV